MMFSDSEVELSNISSSQVNLNDKYDKYDNMPPKHINLRLEDLNNPSL